MICFANRCGGRATFAVIDPRIGKNVLVLVCKYCLPQIQEKRYLIQRGTIDKNGYQGRKEFL